MKCEECGNEHDGSYGSGRFCSNHCRHVYIGKHVKKHVCNFPGRHPFNNWKCPICSEIFKTRRAMRLHKQEVHNFIPGTAWNKGLTKESDARIAKISNSLKSGYLSGKYIPSFKGKRMSDSSRKKMSEVAKLGYQMGIRTGWKSRKITSFPEQFWKRVLDSNHISYQLNFPVSRKSLGDNSSKSYFLDFRIGDNIDLEIDGAQHRYRKEHDKKRDELLTKSGYKVYRIAWNEVKNESGKIQMLEKITKFLNWLKQQS